jgi:muramoyltetrapeptide carboxypeptidase
MPILRCPRLTPGDAVRVVAPSGPVPREEFEAGIAILRRRYQPIYDPAMIAASDGFLAGPDQQRARELNAALADPGARAVFMARGGYGLLRILPFIDLDAWRAHPKTVIGFSDGTALLALAARAGIAAVHGPVITQLPRLPQQDIDGLFGLLEKPGPALLCDNLEAVVPGRVRGPLVGGNLEVFSRLLGTPFAPDPEGAILFIEDIGERPYRVDRLLTHLDLAGVFSAAAGVVVGDFVDCKEPESSRFPSPTVQDVLHERLGRLAIPVTFGARFGHGDRHVALPAFTLAELDTRRGTLTAIEGAVT